MAVHICSISLSVGFGTNHCFAAIIVLDGFEFDADGKICGVKSEGEVVMYSLHWIIGYLHHHTHCIRLPTLRW